MTIRELKRILAQFKDDTKEIIVWNPNTADIDDIESISDNNGNLQLNVEHYREGE